MTNYNKEKEMFLERFAGLAWKEKEQLSQDNQSGNWRSSDQEYSEDKSTSKFHPDNQSGCCEKCYGEVFARDNDKQGYMLPQCTKEYNCPCHSKDTNQ
jgi:hypothetical protein